MKASDVIKALMEVKTYCAVRNATIEEPCEKCIFGNGCCMLNNDPMWWGIDFWANFCAKELDGETFDEPELDADKVKRIMDSVPITILVAHDE